QREGAADAAGAGVGDLVASAQGRHDDGPDVASGVARGAAAVRYRRPHPAGPVVGDLHPVVEIVITHDPDRGAGDEHEGRNRTVLEGLHLGTDGAGVLDFSWMPTHGNLPFTDMSGTDTPAQGNPDGEPTPHAILH